MKRITITTKTSDQIAADFDAVFKAIKPAPVVHVATQADRLAPYRKCILKQRQRGLSWDQISAGMAQPPILEKATARLLKRVFGAQVDAKPAGKKPSPTRVVTPPPPAAPVATTPSGLLPMTPQEHEQFDPLFKNLIPPIVQSKLHWRDAWAYASNAVETFNPVDVVRFRLLLKDELEALTETNCARYGIPPEQIGPWKRRFMRDR